MVTSTPCLWPVRSSTPSNLASVQFAMMVGISQSIPRLYVTVPSFIFDFFAKLGSGSAGAALAFFCSAASSVAEVRLSVARLSDAFLRKSRRLDFMGFKVGESSRCGRFANARFCLAQPAFVNQRVLARGPLAGGED